MARLVRHCSPTSRLAHAPIRCRWKPVHLLVTWLQTRCAPTEQDAAGEGVRLVRVMPNTPCLVGETAAAM